MTTAELIERLRTDDSTQLEEWDLRHASADRLAEQEAEIARQAAAIREIKAMWDWWQADSYDRCASVVSDAIDTALATDQKGGEDDRN